MATGSAARQHFQKWLNTDVLEVFWQESIIDNDTLIGLDCRWQCVDIATTEPPLGGKNIGKEPTERAKQEKTLSLITDTNGITLGTHVARAIVSDIRLLEQAIYDTLNALLHFIQNLVAHVAQDKGCGTITVRLLLEKVSGYILFIKWRPKESKDLKQTRSVKARYRVVDRTHRRLNRFV